MKEKTDQGKGLVYSTAERLAIDFMNTYPSLDAFIEAFPDQQFSRATLAVLKSNNNKPMPGPVQQILSVMGRDTTIHRSLVFIIYKNNNEPQVLTYDKAVAIVVDYINSYHTIDNFIAEHKSRDFPKSTISSLRLKNHSMLPKVVQEILIDMGYTVALNKDHLFLPVEA